LRVNEPIVIDNTDWVFDRVNPNAYIVGASRKVIPIEDLTANGRGYKIRSNVPVEDLALRFRRINWVGSSSVSGGVFWLGKSELITQYNHAYQESSIEVHIFQKQQPSYKWLDWDYDIAIARCEANPTVVVGERVTDDRHWLLVKGDVKCLVGVDWSKYQDDKMTAGISVGDVKAAYEEMKSSSDWNFDNDNPNAYIVGASRRVIPIGSVTSNHRGYKIHSHIPVDELSKKFDGINWVGSSSVSGGVFWLNQEELKAQYE